MGLKKKFDMKKDGMEIIFVRDGLYLLLYRDSHEGSFIRDEYRGANVYYYLPARICEMRHEALSYIASFLKHLEQF